MCGLDLSNHDAAAKDVNFGGFSANEVSCYGKYVVVISDSDSGSGKFLFGELEDGHERKL